MSNRDVEELLAERGVSVGTVATQSNVSVPATPATFADAPHEWPGCWAVKSYGAVWLGPTDIPGAAPDERAPAATASAAM